MKSFRSTGIIATVVALLVAYTVYDSKKEEKDTDERAEKEKILSFKSNEITSVLVKKTEEQIELKKVDGSWLLDAPVKDEAENDGVQAWLDNIANEKGSEIVDANGGETKWENYSLDQPGADFLLRKGDGSEIKFSVSRLAAFDGSYFIRRDQKLLLGTSAWAGIAQKTASQLRNKKIWRRPGAISKMKMEIRHPELRDQFEISKGEDGSWKGLPFEVSSEKVSQFVDELKDIRALDFESGAYSPSDRSKYRFDKPMIKIELTMAKDDGKAEKWSLEVGTEDKGVIYGRSSSVNSVFKLSSFDAKKLRKAQMDFREAKAPFKLAVESVREIKVKTNGQSFEFKKEGSDWKVAKDSSEEKRELDLPNLENLKTRMAGLEAKDFLTSNDRLGEVEQSLEFRDEAGRSLLKLEAGAEFTPKEGANQNVSLRKVRSSLSKELIALNASDWNDLPLNRLFKSIQTEEKSSGQR